MVKTFCPHCIFTMKSIQNMFKKAMIQSSNKLASIPTMKLVFPIDKYLTLSCLVKSVYPVIVLRSSLPRNISICVSYPVQFNAYAQHVSMSSQPSLLLCLEKPGSLQHDYLVRMPKIKSIMDFLMALPYNRVRFFGNNLPHKEKNK